MKSDIFYTNFDQGFRPALDTVPLTRLRGKASKYRLITVAGAVGIWFRVNPKASAIPHHPGEFWPVLEAPASLHHPQQSDDGVISWYQYTSEAQNLDVQTLQQQIYHKVAEQQHVESELWQEMLVAALPLIKASAEEHCEARLPHRCLYYLDAEDARNWGALFSQQIITWVEAFNRQPETLTSYMWRVHWSQTGCEQPSLSCC